jgi:hypothetical protein
VSVVKLDENFWLCTDHILSFTRTAGGVEIHLAGEHPPFIVTGERAERLFDWLDCVNVAPLTKKEKTEVEGRAMAKAKAKARVKKLPYYEVKRCRSKTTRPK